LKLATYSVLSDPLSTPRLGVIIGSKIFDATISYASYLHDVKSEGTAESYEIADKLIPSNMLAFLEQGDNRRTESKKLLEYVSRKGTEALLGPKNEKLSYDLEQEVKLHAPLPKPPSIRDFMCFKSHMENAYRRLGLSIPEIWFEMPAYFRASPYNVIGPSDEIRWPSLTEKLDFEFEFAAYIGKQGRDIDRKNAGEYIAGFSLFNDVSARDRQRAQMQVSLGPGKGKDFETSKVLGPYLVTPDEVDFKTVQCSVRFSGEEVSRGGASDMQFSWEELIEYISQDETIYPGEVFGSGTIGNGSSLEFDRWLKPGDILELEATGFGKLRNKISEPQNRKLWRTKY
jgi:2-keto-4-pentenoate hydratase/2-oxohepta-3-ene-1,7-dioic acid hydratase in catechol pathway